MNKSQNEILKAVRNSIQNNNDMVLAIKYVPDGKDETDYLTDYSFSVKSFNFDGSQSQDEEKRYNASLASMIALDTAMDLYGKGKGIDLNQRQIDRLTFETELNLNKMVHNVAESGELKHEGN